MKKLLVIATASFLLVSCKPACSELDALETAHAADIQEISVLTGWPVAGKPPTRRFKTRP